MVVIVHVCAWKWKEKKKMEKVGEEWGFSRKSLFLKKILIFYLLRQVTGCFGSGVEEQAGEEPLGERS